ncbi:cystine transporter subunit [Salmonella enterica subsp. arizonae]|nr:cystine transporter subunit [Salmonella enterica subsp. arizonae]
MAGHSLWSLTAIFGVIMKLALLGRQALMGVMAVALVAGMSAKSFADEGLLNKVRERGTLLVAWKVPIRRLAFRATTAN